MLLKFSSGSKLFGEGPSCLRTTSATLIITNIDNFKIIDIITTYISNTITILQTIILKHNIKIAYITNIININITTIITNTILHIIIQ